MKEHKVHMNLLEFEGKTYISINDLTRLLSTDLEQVDPERLVKSYLASLIRRINEV